MIPKEHILKCAFFASLLFIVKSENSRSYDTNDWIPVTNCSSCAPKGAVAPQKPTGRVLNLREPVRQFFPEEVVRTKKSNNDQYLREVSQTPVNKPTQRQPEFQQQNLPSTPNFQAHLNEGEVLNPFFRPPTFEQQRHPHLLFSPPLQQFPPQFIFPPASPPFSNPPLFNNPLHSESINSLQQTRPITFQNYTKPNAFASLNPGVINQALTSESFTNSNANFRDASPKSVTSKPGGDSIQLLYVPVDSLNKKIQHSQSQIVKQEVPFQSSQFNPSQDFQKHTQIEEAPLIQQQHQFTDNFRRHRPQAQLTNDQLHKQQQLLSIQHDFAQQALDALNLQLQLQRGQLPTVVQQTIPITTSTTTTPIPVTIPSTTKPKPHQPPLAVYMGGEGDVTVSDVLNLLKNAKTISVQDAVGPNSPQVFVGPHNLEAPDGYVKFDLPYLSSLGSNRIERKVDQLPFFVAPVSYKAPPGYSKIPLPAPHVGSVVISHKEQEKKNDEQNSSFNFASNLNQFLLPPAFEHVENHRLNVPHSQFSHSTASPSFLQQTINEYELAQINNQFRPRPEFQTGVNEYDDVSNFRQQEFKSPAIETTPPVITQRVPAVTETSKFNHFQNNQFDSTSQHKETPHFHPQTHSEAISSDADRFTQFQNNHFASTSQHKETSQFRPQSQNEPVNTDTPGFNEFQTHATSTSQHKETPQFRPQPQKEAVDTNRNKFNHFQNHRPVSTPQHKESFQFRPQPQTVGANLDNEFRPVLPTKNIQQEVFSHNRFIHDYTSVEKLPGDSRPPSTTNPVELELTSSPAPTDSERLVPVTHSRGASQNVELGNENNKNLQYQQQQNRFEQYLRNQDALQSTKETKPLEMINGPLLEPSYVQLNNAGEYVPFKSNHHISHKLVQQPFVEDVHVSSTTETSKQIQSFTEPSIRQTENEYNFNPTQRVQTQFADVISESVPEKVNQDDYKLPSELPTIHPGLHSLINSLQDQSVRPLLGPPLIAPANNVNYNQQLHEQQIVQRSSTEPSHLTTPPVVHTTYTTTTEPTSTTTAYRQRQRGRQRAKSSTTTYAPRRTNQSRGRRPLSVRTTTTTERINYQQEHIDEYAEYSPTRASRTRGGYVEEYNTPEPTQRTINRQRGRVRGRTTQAPQPVNQPESPNFVETTFKQPELISGFEASQVEPQSYMQFENSHISNYNAKHSASTEEAPVRPLENQMNMDVIINHPITENIEPLIISQPEDGSHYVRFNSNIDTSNIVTQRPQETTTSSYVRINARGRVRPRAKTTSTSTTTPSTTTAAKQQDTEEFYGFFRQPNFNSPQPSFYTPVQGGITERPTYISTNAVHYEDQPVENSNNVDIYSTNSLIPSSPTFVGELVTRYVSSTERVTTTEASTPKSTHVTRSRVRGRTRGPPRKVTEDYNRQTYSSQPNEVRGRTRGRTHFVAPKMKDQNKSDDEDVEGGNYPKSFPKVDLKTERPNFQISIEPIIDISSDDQIPYSSIHRPKIVLADGTNRPVANDLPIDRKVLESQEESFNKNESKETDDSKALMEEIISEIDKMQNESATASSDQSPEKFKSPKLKGRRRGVWKLIKRPVESFETAESQYVGKISANSLPLNDKNEKEAYNVNQLSSTEATTKETTAVPATESETTPSVSPMSSTTEESFLDSFYKMFESVAPYEDSVNSTSKTTDTLTVDKSDDVPATESVKPTVLAEVQLTTTTPSSQKEDEATTPIQHKEEISTERIPTTVAQQETEDAITETTWAFKTSTATEISHETEICYRGKCIKSSGNNTLGM